MSPTSHRAPDGGADVVVTAAVLRDMAPPEPRGESHKGERGTVLVVGGARSTPGAVLLAGVAALRAGAGVLRVATVESAATSVAVALPEAMVVALPETADGAVDAQAAPLLRELAGPAQAVLVGPGLQDDDGMPALVAAVAEGAHEGVVVLDAHALSAAGALDALGERAVLTPNAREMADLLGEDVDAVSDDPRAALLRAVDRCGAVVSLRGGQTWTGAPGRPVHLDQAGNPGLGTSGSGDVLTGFLAGLAARGTPPFHAAVWAARVHGQAGQRLSSRLGPLGFLARELLDELSPVMAELSR